MQKRGSLFFCNISVSLPILATLLLTDFCLFFVYLIRKYLSIPTPAALLPGGKGWWTSLSDHPSPSLREKPLEALQAVLPIAAIVLVLCFSIAPVSPSILLCFLLGAAMMLTTAALWTRNMRLTRLLFLLNSPPVFAYKPDRRLLYRAAIEVAAFCSFALAVWRFDLRRPAAGPSSPA